MAASAARRSMRNSLNDYGQKNKTPVGVSAKSQWGNPHRKGEIHSGETPTTSHGGETPTTSKLSGWTAGDGADDLAEGRDVRTLRQPSCLARLRSHLLSTTGVRYRASPPSHRLTSRIASHERLQRISAGCGAPGEPGQNIQHAHNRSVGMKSVTIAGPAGAIAG
jgi:hypothetical protein